MPAPLRRFGDHDPTGRPTPAALAGSLALHAGALALAAVLVRAGPGPPERGAPPAEAVRYLDLAFPDPPASGGAAEAVALPSPDVPLAAAAPAVALPERPGRAETPREALDFPSGTPSGMPPPAVPAGPGGAAGGGESAAGGSPLRPGIRDPRLFPGERPFPTGAGRSRDDVGLRRVPASIKEFNDSVAAEAAGERRRMDWTQTDDAGRRWGIAPGRIYLGRDTILVRSRNSTEATFSGSPQAREESGRAARERAEIDRQLDDRERSREVDERIRATRERRDAQRRAARPDG